MLDLVTLQVVTLTVNIISTVVIIINWRLNPEVPGVAEWAFGRLMVMGAVIVFLLRGQIPDWMVYGVGNIFLALSYYFTFCGARRYMGFTPPRFLPIAIAILVLIFIHVFLIVGLKKPSPIIPIITVIFAIGACITLLSRKGEGFVSARLLAFIFGLHALFYVLQGGNAYLNDIGSWVGSNDYIVSRLVFFEAIVLLIVNSMFFISMTAEYLQADLKRQAAYDHMTGLLNRRYFAEQSDALLSLAHRYEKPLSLIICDIDHFKKVNDTFGHDIGDQAIKAFSKVIKDGLRDSDVIARYGGEEFVATLPETDQQGAIELAERLLKRTNEIAIETEQGVLNFTASFGVTSMETDQMLDELVKNADNNLYKAKEDGRNLVRAGN